MIELDLNLLNVCKIYFQSAERNCFYSLPLPTTSSVYKNNFFKEKTILTNKEDQITLYSHVFFLKWCDSPFYAGTLSALFLGMRRNRGRHKAVAFNYTAGLQLEISEMWRKGVSRAGQKGPK